MAVSLFQRMRLQVLVPITGILIDLDLLAKALGVANSRLIDFRVTGADEEVFYKDDDNAAVNQIRMPGDTLTITHGALAGGAFVAGNDILGLTNGARALILQVVDSTHVIALKFLNATSFISETLEEQDPSGDATGVTATWISDVSDPISITEPAFINATLDYRITGNKIACRTELNPSLITITAVRVALMAQER